MVSNRWGWVLWLPLLTACASDVVNVGSQTGAGGAASENELQANVGGDVDESATIASVEGAPNFGNDYADTHNCGWEEPKDPRDEDIDTEWVEWTLPDGTVDLFVPDPVIEWMDARLWDASHDAWHSIRQCNRGNRLFGGQAPPQGGGFPGAPSGEGFPDFGDAGSPPFGGAFPDFGDGGVPPFGGPGGQDLPPGGGGGNSNSNGLATLCADRPDLIARNQECENARDGYEFMVMHRHMIQAIKQAFPQHAHIFEGFKTFPFDAEDVPEPWQDRFGTGWSDKIRESASILEAIEDNLDLFPTEGDLGMYIQCGEMAAGVTGVHAALHGKWSLFQSPRSLADQTVNLGNYMFWKLHGWIDNIWERYRVAKGLDEDPEDQLEAELEAQCWEMHDLGHIVEERWAANEDETEVVLPDESGTFPDVIRPILDQHCATCHSGASPSGNLTLGGTISAADIVAGLANQPAVLGGQFSLVAPGQPEQSWLYLRAADKAKNAGCMGTNCSAGVMPPTGEVTLSESELAAIYDWIAAGAQATGL